MKQEISDFYASEGTAARSTLANHYYQTVTARQERLGTGATERSRAKDLAHTGSMLEREIIIRMRKHVGIALCVLLACCCCASALDTSLDVDRYAHTAWPIRDRFLKSAVTSIAQTPDGYLWLGTEFGLLRFDGVQIVPWQPALGERLPGNTILSLLAGRDGALWIGTSRGLAAWKNGKLTHYPELAGLEVASLLEDRGGAIWAGGVGISNGRLCAIWGGKTECSGEDGSLGRMAGPFYEDSHRNLWAGTSAGLWRWKPGTPELYPMPDSVLALTEDANGIIVIATPGGIRQFVRGKVEAYPWPQGGQDFRPRLLHLDRDGGLWIGTTDQGLLHVHGGRTDRFTRSEGLTADSVRSLFEDREGNIWVATADGLDRFREFAVPTISLKQGLSTTTVRSVLASGDGFVWLGTDDGVSRWNYGQATTYREQSGLPDRRVQSLFRDEHGRIWVSTSGGISYFDNGRFIPVKGVPPGPNVWSMSGDNAEGLWISEDLSLLHWTPKGLVSRIPWSGLGRSDYALTLLPDTLRGGLWLGFLHGGVAYFKDGRVRASYASVDGLGEGRVNGLQLDRDGTVWAATQGGLSRIGNGSISTLTTRNGLPCDTVHWMVEDDDHSVWLYMTCGLVRLKRAELDAWAANPKRVIQVTVLNGSDGVSSVALTSQYSPQIAKSTDGRLWFVTGEGISVVDPRHLPLNRLPPPVHIEQITADRRAYPPAAAGSGRLRLPPLVRDLEIDYTALSLIAPEKVLFRYKLEGWDRDWQDAGTRRRVFYAGLPPGPYRFRVSACNNSGLWNEAGDFLDFSIDPAYYQTALFRALCVAAFLALMWGLHRYRLHRIGQEFAARMDERMRIARELHDTLLQTFHGLMLRLQVVDELLPPGKAKEELEETLECADQAIIESRDAVRDLRSSAMTTNDLGKALRALGNELAGEGSATFRLLMEGPARDLHPIVRDELYRIASEALRNAFRHARAHHIEAEITYAERLLRLRIRDDGEGIAPEILREGRSGHYGLPGIRERARQLGSKLSIRSGPGVGTEIDLSVAGSIAYSRATDRSRLWLFRKKVG